MTPPLASIQKNKAPLASSLFRSAKHKSPQIALYPTLRSDQKHGFLLVTAFAERKDPAIGRPPALITDMKSANESSSGNDQVKIGLLIGAKQTPKLQLIAPHPQGRFRALEYAMGHSQKVMRIEAAGGVKTCIAANLGPLAYAAVHYNAGGVEVHRLAKATGIILLPAKPFSPDTAEACHRYEHGVTPLAPCG